MKLTAKIGVVFGATVLATILAVGGVTIGESYNMAMNDIDSNLSTSARLASNQISSDFEGFLKMAEVTGEDPIITGEGDKQEKSERISELAEEYGFTSGNVLNASGVSLRDNTDYSDREYVQKALAGEANVSEVTQSKITGKFGCSIAAPLTSHESEEIEGVVYFRMDNDFMDKIISEIQISDNSYAFIVDKTGTIIAHPNAEMVGNINILDQIEDMTSIMTAMGSGEAGSAKYSFEGEEMSCGYSPIRYTDGWMLIVTAPDTDFTAPIFSTVKRSIIVDVCAVLIALGIAFWLAGSIGKAASTVSKSLKTISEGDFSSNIKKTNRKDEIGELQNVASSLEEAFKDIICEANRVLGAMSRYDLSVVDMKNYPGEFNSLATSVNEIKSILGGLISEVQESASSVGVGSGQLASAADALSRGTVSQASSIDQVVVDVQDVTERIRRNSDNEEVVEGKLKNLGSLINSGNDEMTELLRIVKEVEEMSADIQKIVGAIDSIAFQTNILALNASVEAARAGDNGKGFAVVADEVGALAAKTSEASKQTAELIGRCIDRINQAMKSADTTFDCLKKIVDNSNEISEAFEEIAHDTRQQAQKSTDIRQAMDSISDVVQTNTATAEETAAATQELSDQASNLSRLIAKFRI